MSVMSYIPYLDRQVELENMTREEADKQINHMIEIDNMPELIIRNGESLKEMIMKDKEIIMKALSACNDFYCGECPYQYLDDREYSLRCIHTLVADVYELLKKNWVGI